MCGFVKNHLGRLAPSKRLSLDEDSLKIQVKKIEEKTGVFSISLYLTAVRGRSYAEGAQRDSGAIPLRVPATGGVADMINFRLRTFLPISRAASHKA